MALSAPEPLSATHDVSAFSCGQPMLDRWLKERALSNQQSGFISLRDSDYPLVCSIVDLTASLEDARA